MKKLSSSMLNTYKTILQHPYIEFVKIGSYRRWTYPNCKMKRGNFNDKPIFEASSSTVQGLIKRGLLKSLDENKDFYSSKYKAIYNKDIFEDKIVKINSKEYICDIAKKYDFDYSDNAKYFRLYIHGNPNLSYFKSKGHGAIFGIEIIEHFNKYKNHNFEKIFKLARKYFETKRNKLETLEIFKTFKIYENKILLFDPISNTKPENARVIQIKKYLLNKKGI